MSFIPSTINKENSAFGYGNDAFHDICKNLSYIPLVSTVIGFDRMSHAIKDKNIELSSRIAHFTRGLFELIPIVNFALIPLDIGASVIMAAQDKINKLRHKNNGNSFIRLG